MTPMELVLLGFGVVAVAGLLLVMDRVIDDYVFGFKLIVGTAFIDVALQLPRPAIAGIAIQLKDVVFSVITVAVVAKFLRGWRPTRMQRRFLLVTVILVASIVRGAVGIGIPAAVNEARVHLFFMAPVLYASLAMPTADLRERVANLWQGYAAALMALAVLRWAIVFGGLPGRGSWFDPAYGGLRVIKSDETMVVGLALIILVPLVIRGEATRRQLQLAVLFGGGVLLLQHRSVISMVLLGVLVQVWSNRSMISRAALFTLLGIGAIGAVVFFALADGQVAVDVGSSQVAGTGTFEWRVEGWQALIRRFADRGPFIWLFGEPFGSGWDRVLPSTGQTVSVGPHNMYVELLLRIGVVGLLVFVGILGYAWVQLRGTGPAGRGVLLDDSTLSAAIVAFSVFMIPYQLFFETGILLGLALRAVTFNSGPGVEQDLIEQRRALQRQRL